LITLARDDFFALFSDMVALHAALGDGPVRPSHFNICTMTIVGVLSIPRVDLAALTAHFEDPSLAPLRAVQPLPGMPPDPPVLISLGEHARFFNQVTLNYRDSSTKAIKVFSNGKLHIAGCKSLQEFGGLALQVCRLLEASTALGAARAQEAVDEVREGLAETELEAELLSEMDESPDEARARGIELAFDLQEAEEAAARAARVARETAGVRVTDTGLHLINCNFKLNFRLDLEALADRLKEFGKLQPEYDADNYPGVRVRMKGEKPTCLLIFNSGCVIVTGVKRVVDIFPAYDFVVRFVAEHAEHVRSRNTRANTGKGGTVKEQRLIEGYPASLYWAVS